MNFYIFIGIVFILLGVFILIDFLTYGTFVDEEIITTTTVTTTTDIIPTLVDLPTLEREREGKSYYVIDPADREHVWVNSGDDMYEDADGKIWRLV